MSNTLNTRSAANNDKRTSASYSARPRVPSSRAGIKDRPPSGGELLPADSASNAPSRRANSTAYKVNGSVRTTTERQTGKVQVTTRNSLSLRSQSPFKAQPPNESGFARPQGPQRSTSQLLEKQASTPKEETMLGQPTHQYRAGSY